LAEVGKRSTNPTAELQSGAEKYYKVMVQLCNFFLDHSAFAVTLLALRMWRPLWSHDKCAGRQSSKYVWIAVLFYFIFLFFYFF